MSDNLPARADQLIDHLMTLHPKGYDLSLGRITMLLERLGNPQDKLPPIIHVAGTNGKGSFTAFSRALLEAEGYKVHVHTSPHLVSWHERFRIGRKGGGQLVDDVMLADAISRVAEANQGQSITVFEILSAVMFLLFSEQPADVVIIEVGLGGRFDATNVIKEPAISVIMPVSIDHQSLLGDTAEKIAFEKAGIIKKRCPVVVSKQPFDEALHVIEARANELGCAASIFGQDFAGSEEHGRFVYQDEDGLMDLPKPALMGKHQYINAATAIRAVRDAGFPISQKAAEEAMRNVYWPGRFQALPKGELFKNLTGFNKNYMPEIYVDGGHNADAAGTLVNIINQLDQRDQRPLYLISAMLNTKDPSAFFANFKDLAEYAAILPITSSDAGVPNEKLTTIVNEAGIAAESIDGIRSAFEKISALHTAKHPQNAPRILICGSLYLVGDVLLTNGTPPV
jgi:dihydrofolate synthase/folylpolyglutamate synthase